MGAAGEGSSAGLSQGSFGSGATGEGWGMGESAYTNTGQPGYTPSNEMETMNGRYTQSWWDGLKDSAANMQASSGDISREKYMQAASAAMKMGSGGGGGGNRVVVADSGGGGGGYGGATTTNTTFDQIRAKQYAQLFAQNPQLRKILQRKQNMGLQ
jgi:hypothetical protein